MFTPDSRWDRHLPHQSHQEEPIEVGVIFKEGKLLPKWFTRNGRKYSIKEITYQWQDHRGNESLYFFSVSDGANLYQIYLNNRYLHWRLAKVCPPQI